MSQQPNKNFFITSTGTGIGKTFVTCMLGYHLQQQGSSVRTLKPIISGWEEEDNDTINILKSLALPVTASTIHTTSPWRLNAPLSPDMAAEKEGKTLPFEEITAFCNTPSPHDMTLIEGAGGVMTPIGEHHTILDLIAATSAQSILVTGSYLGSLSHTLTALETLKIRNIPLAAIIISESENSTVTLEETTNSLRRFTHAPIISLPRIEDYKTFLNISEMLSIILKK